MGRPPKNKTQSSNVPTLPDSVPGVKFDDPNMFRVHEDPNMFQVIDPYIPIDGEVPGFAEGSYITVEKAPRWTYDKPTEEKYYYYWEPGLNDIKVLRMKAMWSGTLVAILGDYNYLNLATLKGKFWGPLPEPEDPIL